MEEKLKEGANFGLKSALKKKSIDLGESPSLRRLKQMQSQESIVTD